MKFIATIDFSGIEGMPFRYYKGHIYELENNETVKKLVKVGYLQEFEGFKEIKDWDFVRNIYFSEIIFCILMPPHLYT